MNSIQRGWRSVIRKPVKSVLLLLIVVVITLFLTAGLASANASIDMQDQTRQAIGAGLSLMANETNRSKRMEELAKQLGGEEGSVGGYHAEKMERESGIQWHAWTDNFFETLQEEEIRKLAATDGIENYNITTAETVVNPIGFKRIEDEDTDQSYDLGGVTLIGNREMAMHQEILTGNISLKEGRLITENEVDVCIISKELAEKNGLCIGETMRFNSCSDPDKSDIYEAVIVGIYEGTENLSPLMSGDTYRAENIIFTDLRFPEKPEGNEGDPLYLQAYFQVQDVDRYEEVKAAVQEVDIDWERYDLIDNNGNLSTMASNFNDLKNISILLVAVITAAGFVILSLIFTFWMKSRTREVGVLLAIGESKAAILGQMLLEALLITAAACLVSFAAVPAVSRLTADYLVVQQVQAEEEKHQAEEANVATEYEAPKQNVIGVQVQIDHGLIAGGTACVAALVSLSVITAGTHVVKRKPKHILSEMS